MKLSTKGIHSSSSGINGGMGMAGGGVLVPDILAPRKYCPDHDYDSMKPLVLATWKHNFQVIKMFISIENVYKILICYRSRFLR